jgi:NAD(P)-dependent dehydrogenase (short-subunit alcohol dehydrogenase family)
MHLAPYEQLGKPEEIAVSAADLAPDKTLLYTGLILPVDGGYLSSGNSAFSSR